jgi:hypothetical protein
MTTRIYEYYDGGGGVPEYHREPRLARVPFHLKVIVAV